MANGEISRLLVVTDDPGAEADLRPRLERLTGGGELELKIVAPIRPDSGLDLFTGEVDDSIAAAADRAEATAADGERSEGVAATEVEVGDADQLQAIADALATFAADRIVLVAPDEDLPEQARERFELPVEVLAAE
jgi:hypothetical protein